MHVYYVLLASNLLFTSAQISQSIIHHLNCELGLIENQFCSVDGGWTSWNSWSPCMGECGSIGRKTRNRQCTSPLPSTNGAPCLGSDRQTISCQITGCSFENYEKTIQNNSERQTEIQMIKIFHEELPALVELCFSANCAFSVIENILGENTITYWNTMNCIKYGIGCLVIGGWSDWKGFSLCTALCGKGYKYRQRYCNNPTPSNLQLQCEGLPYELRNCTGYNCHRELSGSWGPWTRWSSCNVKCGHGIQMKSRKCNENIYNTLQSNDEKTSCKGINQQIKACRAIECSVTGGWSVWTSWTACSLECGIGTQSRNRVCNNPLPSGNGSFCVGSATDIRQCFNEPCSVKMHEIAVFSGQSSLLYSPRKDNFHLLHVYIRFRPSSPFGILCRRYEESNCIDSMCDFVKISLHNGKVILVAQISQCTLVLVNEHKLEIGNWHEIFIVICGTYGTLRIDDKIHKTAYFSCTPKSTNVNHYMEIGKNFLGQIQKISINFIPIELGSFKNEYNQEDKNIPLRTNNIAYAFGDYEEESLHMCITESLTASCPRKAEKWRIIITLKPENLDGIIAMIPGYVLNNYLMIFMERGRVKLIFHQNSVHKYVESYEFMTIEEWIEITIVKDYVNIYFQINRNKKHHLPSIPNNSIRCWRNLIIGAIPDEIKENICPKCMKQFGMEFVLGSLNIDEKQFDLHSLPVQEITSKRYSSRTISFSGYYQEMAIPLGQELKLSCFYDRNIHELNFQPSFINQRDIVWLFIDKPLNRSTKDYYNLKTDERISDLRITSYPTRDSIEGFYSCHVKHSNLQLSMFNDKIFNTFGVIIITENEEIRNIPWEKWMLINVAIMINLGFLISWFLCEGLWDILNGYGFYRLPHKNKIFKMNSMLRFIHSKDGKTLIGNPETIDVNVHEVIKDRSMLHLK